MSRELQNVLNSGEITNISLGGVTADDAVPKKSDLTAPNIDFDDTGLGITATNVDQALSVLAEVGLLVMSGNALAPQSIGTSPTKVTLFGTKNVQAGVGVTGDVALQRATATLDGVFKIRFEAFVQYASNVDITWQIYKNGVAFGNSITLSGQGSKNMPITILTSTTLVATDYIELYATASATTDLTIAQTNGALEKTIF